MVKDGVTYRVISDHLGSVRLVVNSADGDGSFVCEGAPFEVPLEGTKFDLVVKEIVEGDVVVGDDSIEITGLKGIKVKVGFFPKAIKGLEVVPGSVRADL